MFINILVYIHIYFHTHTFILHLYNIILILKLQKISYDMIKTTETLKH